MAIGARRLVVGAHYGLRDWIVQRATAVVLIMYLVALTLRIAAAGHLDYRAWVGIFEPTAMKVVTLVAWCALIYHSWIGIRDIWMDYVRSTGLRLLLQFTTFLWLAGCFVWAVQSLWRA
jgi:succinate dehydrogenase / fumarate reductase, membrane anchor subunit